MPPPAYGGIEAVVALLADGLVAQGHEVTLVASGDSHVEGARLVAPFDSALRRQWGDGVAEMVHVLEGIGASDADIVHDHSIMGALAWQGVRDGIVLTMHGPATGSTGRVYRALADRVSLLAISTRQATDLGMPVAGIVPNAIDLQALSYSGPRDDHLVFLGRFSVEKGAHHAIAAARETGRKIMLAGKIHEPGERKYFEESIRPLLGAGVEYVGEIGGNAKVEFLGRAAALLCPITWAEPFGLVMAEAAAVGTPAIAFSEGAVPEVVAHGRSGFVVRNIDEMVAAVGRIEEIDPKECRRWAEEEFGPPLMVERTVAAYRKVLAARTTGGAETPSR